MAKETKLQSEDCRRRIRKEETWSSWNGKSCNCMLNLQGKVKKDSQLSEVNNENTVIPGLFWIYNTGKTFKWYSFGKSAIEFRREIWMQTYLQTHIWQLIYGGVFRLPTHSHPPENLSRVAKDLAKFMGLLSSLLSSLRHFFFNWQKHLSYLHSKWIIILYNPLSSAGLFSWRAVTHSQVHPCISFSQMSPWHWRILD